MYRNRAIKLTGHTLILASFLLLALPSAASAQTHVIVYDFEDGTDAQVVTSPFPEMEFTRTGGKDWIYGDWRKAGPVTGELKYNGPYPDGAFYSDGNFFGFLGPNQNNGIITFVDSVANYVSIDYAAAGVITLEAYNASGTLIDSDTNDPNTATGAMDNLYVAGEIAWMKILFLGNHWIIDNIEAEVRPVCQTDADCDDGTFCNGAEYCDADHYCQMGSPVLCPDDGLFCNGTEYCNELLNICGHQNAPLCLSDGLYCNGVEFCDETIDDCGHKNAPSCEDDGVFCNGTEQCNEATDGCVSANPPECADDALWCNGIEFCDEEAQSCGHKNAPVCVDDGTWCNGEESCDEVNDECGHVNAPDCSDDGKFCNGDEYCDEDNKSCGHKDAPECGDDGQYCNGSESCSDEWEMCISSGNPCSDGYTCDETADDCIPPEGDPGWPEGDISGGCCG